MKTCTRCKESKALELFTKRSSASDGLSSWCKQCCAEHAAERYQSGDKVRKVANRASSVLRAKEFIRSYLNVHPCVDCGNSDLRVLEFDHRDGVDKKFSISNMYHLGVTTIKQEVEKCDVRCANCHRIRTTDQFGWWRGQA